MLPAAPADPALRARDARWRTAPVTQARATGRVALKRVHAATSDFHRITLQHAGGVRAGRALRCPHRHTRTVPSQLPLATLRSGSTASTIT